MNRRQFTKTIGIGAIALGLTRTSVRASAQTPQLAITMDDFRWSNWVRQTPEKRSEAVLGVLNANRIKATLFVMAGNVETERGKNLLRTWDAAGHVIGNHTYSHHSLNSQISAADYEAYILHAEEILKGFSQ